MLGASRSSRLGGMGGGSRIHQIVRGRRERGEELDVRDEGLGLLHQRRCAQRTQPERQRPVSVVRLRLARERSHGRHVDRATLGQPCGDLPAVPQVHPIRHRVFCPALLLETVVPVRGSHVR
eukprot:626679-Rhodomonas_salina.2